MWIIITYHLPVPAIPKRATPFTYRKIFRESVFVIQLTRQHICEAHHTGTISPAYTLCCR